MATIGTSVSVQEDLDASLDNGLLVLGASATVEDPDLTPAEWQVTEIVRLSANYTGTERGDPDSGIYPEAPVGSLSANVVDGGLDWHWTAPNRAFDWMENDRSVSEDWAFRAVETYRISLVNAVTGAVREETVSVEVTGNSDETFDVLVLGSDPVSVNGASGTQRVADNLLATGLVDHVQAVEFGNLHTVNLDTFDAVLVYTNAAPANAVAVGDALQDYVDRTTGGVVIGNFAFNQDYALAGGIMEDGYAAFDIGPGTGSAAPVGDEIIRTAAGVGDALFDGIDLAKAEGAFLRNGNLTRPAVDADATLLAVDQNGTPLIAESQSGRVLSMNFFPRDLGSSNIGPGGESLLTPGEREFYELFVNALHAVNADPQFAAPSAADLSPVARTETVGGLSCAVYEAEDAALSSKVTTVGGRNASGDAFVDFESSNVAQHVTWTVEVAEDGVYALDILYALAAHKDLRPLTLVVDGEAADVLPFIGRSTRDETVWSPESAVIELTAGRHTISLLTPAGRGVENGANIDALRLSEAPVDPATLTSPVAGTVTKDGVAFLKYEAETADLSDEMLFDTGRGASGGVFVDVPVNDDPLTVAWTIAVAEDGVYAVDFAYALASTKPDRPLTLLVDGEFVDVLPFEARSNAAETTWALQSTLLDLEAGVHAIALVTPSDRGRDNGANLDFMQVSAAPLADDPFLA